jgi:hypothetical protein
LITWPWEEVVIAGPVGGFIMMALKRAREKACPFVDNEYALNFS